MKCIIFLSQINESTILSDAMSIVLIIMCAFIIALKIYLDKKIKYMNDEKQYRDEIFNVVGSNSDNVLWIYNAKNSSYEYISSNFEKALEISKKDIISDGSIMLKYLPEEKREKVMALFHSTGDLTMLEEDFEYITPISKTKSHIMLRAYPIFNHNEVVRFVCITTDITKEKQSEKALEDALNSLSKANEAKKLFLSHMSHELKTPINAIIGMTQIAFDSQNDQHKVEDCLNKINTSSRKLLALINNILDISKIDSEKLILVNEPFHLCEALTSFSSIMNTQAELNNQNYTLIMNHIQNDLLLGDSLRLVQILENCISNSIKFTPPGGEIRLEVTEVEKHANKALFSFVVSDNGKGMSEAYIKHLFEPFEQEDNSIAQKYGGTGIGMTIAKELVNLMGGNINVTSKINAGTTVTINIVFQISLETLNIDEIKDSSKKLMKYDAKGLRILVVEDNEINLEIATELLRNINMEVETATNGFEALRLFETSQKGYYNIILMDIIMPELDGFETAKAIRESTHPDAKSICIIALTADDDLDEQLFKESGMNYSFQKSFDYEKFSKFLKQIRPSNERFTNSTQSI